MALIDQVTSVMSFLFTLLILSYMFGDGPLFRVAVYIFVGVSSGFVGAVAFWYVIVPRLIYPLMNAAASGDIFNLVFLGLVGLGALLLASRWSGRITLAYLVGVGAAVTLAGALGGTLIPQILATINAFDMKDAAARNIVSIEASFNGVIILAGTVLTLAYFHFGARPAADGSMRRFVLIEILAWGGRVFIGFALGAVFAGIFIASLSALVERIYLVLFFIQSIIG